MDFVSRFALTILISMLVIISISSTMTFIDVDPVFYNPFIYFIIMLLIFHLILSPSPSFSFLFSTTPT
jgi:hypothetical protein